MNEPKGRVGFEIKGEHALGMTALAVDIAGDRIFVVVAKPADVRIRGFVDLGERVGQCAVLIDLVQGKRGFSIGGRIRVEINILGSGHLLAERGFDSPETLYINHQSTGFPFSFHCIECH